MIYFVRNNSTLAVKIGFSSHPKKRLAQLQSANMDRLTLIIQIPGEKEDEKRLHQEFASHRISGEWFEPNQQLSETIERLIQIHCVPLPDKLKVEKVAIDPIPSDDVRQAVRAEIAKAGGLRALAKAWNISPSWISKFLSSRGEPGPKILTPLGIKKTTVTMYISTTESAPCTKPNGSKPRKPAP